MKKTVCLFLALLLFLSAAAAYAEEADEGVYVIADAPTDEKEDPLASIGSQETDISQSYEDLAVSGPYVWQVMEGEIRCIDARTRQTAAEIPVSALYPDPEDYLALTAFGGTVTLCAVTGMGGDCRVTLYELALQDGTIVPVRIRDATEKLAFLFDGSAVWMEADIIACAGGFLVTALDMDMTFRLYLYDPETPELRELGTQAMDGFTAVFACGEDLLLMGPGEDPENEALTRISLSDGGREPLGSFRTDSMTQPSCAALNEAEGMLYYLIDGVGYRVRIAPEAEPEPFCAAQAGTALLRYGALAENSYIVLDEEGGLLYQDAAGALKAEKLRILDLTGAELLTDVLPLFNASAPDYLAVLVSGDESGEVLNEMMNQSADYDAFVINLGSGLYSALSAKGYLGDLGGSAELAEAAAALPERIRSLITAGGKLTAFPVAVENSVLLLDTAAVTGLTGLSREEIPTDWTGFLKLLSRMGEDGLLDGSGYCLFESGVSAETMRTAMMTSILQDARLWLNRDGDRLSGLAASLTPALQALDGMDWTQFGLAEDDEGGEWAGEDEEPALLEWINPEIAVMELREGTEFWPLSLAEGGERLVPQDVAVIVLNPRSARSDGVVRLAESLYTNMDIVTRMELDGRLNEPVANPNFDEDMAYLQSLVPMYEQSIAEAESSREAAELQEELDDMRGFLANYEKNGAWLVSADSIALYRSLEDLFAVHGDEFWDSESESSIFLRYLDGMLDPVQFVRQLVSTLQMSRMESE